MPEPTGQPGAAAPEPNGQPASGQPAPAEPNGNTVEYNGQQLSPEKASELLKESQAQITKLQMAEAERNKKEEPVDPDKAQQLVEAEALVDVLMPILEKKGVATQDSVKSLQNSQELEKFVASDESLAGKKELLQTLKKQHPEMPLVDIAAKYKLTEKKANAPSGDVMGDSQYKPKEGATVESIGDADSLAKFEQEQGIGGKKKFSMQQSV